MENWFSFRNKLMAIVFATLAVFTMSFSENNSNNSSTWGFYGHKRINRVAIFTLPPEMFGFFKEHIEYITEHAVDPDKRRYAMKGEAECHFIDIDHYVKYNENPFEAVPKHWKEAVEKFTEDTLRAYGIVPWHILTMKYKLQRAFEAKNVDLILKYASEIGHYVADAHVPLHTTENYNGQLTGQRGIHGLWESRLVEINMDDYNYFVGKSRYIEDPLENAWDYVKNSHHSLDTVLRFEKELTKEFPIDKKYAFEQRGNLTIQTYSYDFSQEYHKRMNGMVERRMRNAILSVGSMWYTAWVDAGQPDLSKLQNVPPSAELLKEMAELDALFQLGEAHGRNCEH